MSTIRNEELEQWSQVWIALQSLGALRTKEITNILKTNNESNYSDRRIKKED